VISPLAHWLATISIVVSLVVSVGTLIYTAMAVRQSKLSAIGALRSATAAEDQVELSRSQVADSVQSALQAKESADMSRLSVLETARQRIYEQSPKPLVTIDRSVCHPVFGGDGPGFPTVEAAKRVLDPIAFWERRFEYVYFPVRGTLVNEGSDSMRVGLIGITFTSGITNLATGNVVVPPIAHPTPKLYLIRAGEVAVFDWWAGTTVDNWADFYNGDEKIRECLDGTFVCFPGAANGPVTRVKIRLLDKPLKPGAGNPPRSWTFSELNQPTITIEWKREYREDTNLVRQELTEDFWDGRTFWSQQLLP
jgi:hypothetical protein